MSEDRHGEFLMRFTKAQTALRSYVFAHIRGYHQAEDAYQKLALALWKSYDRYRPENSFEAWAFGVARNTVLSERRAMARSRVILSGDIGERFEECLAQESTLFDQRQSHMSECLEKLDEKTKTLLWMRYRDRLSMDAVATHAGCTANALGVFLCRVRRAIAECMERASRHAETEGQPI
jgi:RNA polymerase sigma-70 factor (ECF subfamily)